MSSERARIRFQNYLQRIEANPPRRVDTRSLPVSTVPVDAHLYVFAAEARDRGAVSVESLRAAGFVSDDGLLKVTDPYGNRPGGGRPHTVRLPVGATHVQVLFTTKEL